MEKQQKQFTFREITSDNRFVEYVVLIKEMDRDWGCVLFERDLDTYTRRQFVGGLNLVVEDQIEYFDGWLNCQNDGKKFHFKRRVKDCRF